MPRGSRLDAPTQWETPLHKSEYIQGPPSCILYKQMNTHKLFLYCNELHLLLMMHDSRIPLFSIQMSILLYSKSFELCVQATILIIV